jgi:hypothetical protein
MMRNGLEYGAKRVRFDSVFNVFTENISVIGLINCAYISAESEG